MPARLLAMLALVLAPAALGGCNNFFFQPDPIRYFVPSQFGLWHEEVTFTSADGTELSGWFLPARPPAQGTIIHFHGNAANITNHIYGVRWLPPRGFSVFLFDYRGYGASEGSPSREGAIEDGAAAIRYVRSRPDVDPNRLIVYGQSLGGALAVNALAEAGTAGVKALVLEATFRSYRELIVLKMRDTLVLWPFQYPVAYLLFTDHLSPEEALPALSTVPTLVIHGEADFTVPFAAGKRLFESVASPDRTFWAVGGAGHLGVFGNPGSFWRGRLIAYLRDRLDRKNP